MNHEKIDEMVLALLYLGIHDEYRAWKGFDWDALSRLHEKGLLENPVNKAKSVEFTQEGKARAESLFNKYFADKG